MGWWKSYGFSSASTSATNSASTSSSPPPTPGLSARRDISSLWSTAVKRDSSSRGRQQCLTRQRKVRRPSNVNLLSLAGEFARKKKGVSTDSSPMSRSPSNLDGLPVTSRSASSSTPLPHPLPLPEGQSGGSPLPSPRTRWSREDGSSELSPVLAEPWPERLPSPNNSVTSRSPHVTMVKGPEHVDSPVVAQTSGHRRTIFQYSSTIDDYMMLNIPTRSAPTSAICSPALSPRRPNSGEHIPSGRLATQPPQCLATQSPQRWSTSDFSDFVTGFHGQVPAEKFLVSPECSPLHSPTAKSPGLGSRNPSAPSSPLHPRMFPENSTAPSSHFSTNIHPLPRPPGAPSQIQSPFGHPSPTKGDALPMRSQWKKGKLIGRGTFGSVYIATNRQTGALCAMKDVDIVPDDPKSIECIKQLQQEIRFLSQLEHPNIVKYYGCEIIEDHFYIYLEYVHPGSINKYIHDHCGAITESVIRNFTRHILMGLAYLHGQKAIHRDIKGANLLVDSNGIVKLADFGMAKHLNDAKFAYSMSGSPYWMAPEVLHASMNKESGYNSSVDIWSLGCTIIEMYTGKHPWSDLPYAAAMFKVLHGSPDIPETLSPEGKEFLHLCFLRDPAERPSASELLEHRFVANSHHHDLHSFVQVFSEINLSDEAHLSTRYTPLKNDTAIKGKHMANGGATHVDAGEVATSHLSPRSTLEVRSFSPPHMIQCASFLPGLLPDGINAPQWRNRKPPNHFLYPFPWYLAETQTSATQYS